MFSALFAIVLTCRDYSTSVSTFCLTDDGGGDDKSTIFYCAVPSHGTRLCPAISIVQGGSGFYNIVLWEYFAIFAIVLTCRKYSTSAFAFYLTGDGGGDKSTICYYAVPSLIVPGTRPP